MPADVKEPLSWSQAPDLLSIKEAVRLTRVGEKQIRRIAKREGLEARFDGAIRIPKPALRKFVQEQLSEDYADALNEPATKNGDGTTGEGRADG